MLLRDLRYFTDCTFNWEMTKINETIVILPMNVTIVESLRLHDSTEGAAGLKNKIAIYIQFQSFVILQVKLKF